MIIINNDKYYKINCDISYGEYDINQNRIKRTGLSPFISFKIDDKIIGIETVYDKKLIENLNIDKLVDITKYITDITFEDNEGWLSLIHGKYNCSICKKDKKTLYLELEVKCEEDNTFFDIKIKENINITNE